MALRRIVYLLSLVGAVIFFMAYKLWFAWYILVIMLCLPIVSLLLSLPAILNAQLDHSVFRHMCVKTQIRLSLLCGKFPTLPWRCKMLVRQPLTGEKWTLHAGDTFPTDHCGTLLCTVQKLKIYDYLGLFAITHRNLPTQRIYVQPTPVATRPPSRNHISALSWKPKWGGGFSENHELRLYQPGDSVRQIHWKLSAKTGELIFRQPMEAVQGQLLVRLDLSGTPAALDRKLGKLLWLCRYLLWQKMSFRIQVLAGDGAHVWPVTDAAGFYVAFDELLTLPATGEKIPATLPNTAEWQYFIGGDGNEA